MACSLYVRGHILGQLPSAPPFSQVSGGTIGAVAALRTRTQQTVFILKKENPPRKFGALDEQIRSHRQHQSHGLSSHCAAPLVSICPDDGLDFLGMASAGGLLL